jgi:integration host factor subunit alpha
MALRKTDIVQDIYENCGLTKTKSAELAETIFEIIKSTLESGEPVLVNGFGKFEVQEKQAETGRNPQKDSEWILGGGRSVTFKCSPILKNKMNTKWKH